MGSRRYFSTTAKGLEGVLAREIEELGGKDPVPSAGGVSFAGAGRLRTAPEALYEGVKAIPWPDLFPLRKTFAIDASCRDSKMTHSGFAALKAKDAVADRFREAKGARPSVDTANPQVRIHVRIYKDVCILSLDTSGESLNQRGYRAEPALAALRETVAAGLLLLAGWDGQAPLIDPTCGTRTIPIEAALLATNTAPGLLRRSFAFEHLSLFEPKRWEHYRKEAEAAIRGQKTGRIEGSDIDPEAIRAAKGNAKRAGMPGRVNFAVRDIREFDPGSPPGILLCNPPYGVRTPGGVEVEAFYRALGEALKKRCKGWTAYLLSGNPEATRHLGLKASRKFPVMNGPINCRLLKYEMY